MKIHEYQAKAILAKFGVPVPRGEVVFKADEARGVAERLGTRVTVVKAQIHAGGRGKGGGVKLAKSPDEAATLAGQILGMKLVTPQTGEEGRIVRRLLIEEGLDIKRELYLSMLVDRAVGAPVFMASTAGGMEIEEVAHKNPEAILREPIHPASGFQPYHARKLAFGLGLPAEMLKVASAFFESLYRASGNGRVAAGNQSLRRDRRRQAGRARREGDSRRQRALSPSRIQGAARSGRRNSARSGSLEIQTQLHQARRHHRLHGERRGPGDGHDGHHQAERRQPGEFSGRGRRRFGRAGEKRVSDFAERSEREGVFVNIFGGILRCDVLASGVVNAAKELKFKIPVVIRMEGTNVKQGQEILRNSGLNFTVASGMKDGAEKVVALAGGAR